MKLLETTQTRAQSFYSRVLHVVTTSVSSLLIWTRMSLSVGFVIIMAVTLGVLLDVLVRISNYRNGTKLQTGQIFHDFLNYSWKKGLAQARQNSNSQRNS